MCEFADANGCRDCGEDTSNYRKLYEEQRKETAKWREAAEVLRATLRDQFAMSALQGVVCCTDPAQDEARALADTAYQLADAMLESRKAR